MNDKYKGMFNNLAQMTKDYNKLNDEIKKLKDKIYNDQKDQQNMKKNYGIIIKKLLKNNEEYLINEISQKEKALKSKEEYFNSSQKLLILQKNLFESEKKKFEETKKQLLKESNDLK